MFPAADIRLPIGTILVANGNVCEFKVELGGTKNQVKVSEGIELSKVTAVLAICS